MYDSKKKKSYFILQQILKMYFEKIMYLIKKNTVSTIISFLMKRVKIIFLFKLSRTFVDYSKKKN